VGVNYMVISQVNVSCLEAGNFTEFNEGYVAFVHSRIRRTSAGCDSGPFWFFRHFIFENSPVLVKLSIFLLTTALYPNPGSTLSLPHAVPVSKVSDLRPLLLLC